MTPEGSAGLVPGGGQEGLAPADVESPGERLEVRPMYGQPFRTRCCLLPAAGCYEWHEMDGRKVRHCIRSAGVRVRAPHKAPAFPSLMP